MSIHVRAVVRAVRMSTVLFLMFCVVVRWFGGRSCRIVCAESTCVNIMALRYQLQLMGRLRKVLPTCGGLATTLNQPVHHQPVLHNALRRPLVISCCRYAKGANRPKHSGKEAKPKIALTDDELAEVVRIQNFRSEMQKVLQRLQESFIKHLTINSAAGSIDTIPVHVDGQEYSLAEVAQIAKKNPQLIVLHMASFPDAIKPTLQAIQASGLNISTQQDGTTVFCHLPK